MMKRGKEVTGKRLQTLQAKKARRAIKRQPLRDAYAALEQAALDAPAARLDKLLREDAERAVTP